MKALGLIKKYGGLIIAGAAAVAAFTAEVDSQKKEKTLKELTERVTKLEEK